MVMLRCDLRRLEVPGLDELLGAGVFYGAAVTRRLRWRASGLSSSAARTRLDKPRYTWPASPRR